VSAAIGGLALLLATLLPGHDPRWRTPGRGLALLGALALLPAAESSGAWPFVLLAAAAAALATPLPLVLAAAGAARIALGPETAAPVAAGVAGLAVAAVAGALVLWVRGQRARGADALDLALVAGALLVLVLAGVDRGAVFSWTFGVESETGRVVLRGVGLPLGGALLTALGGVLLLASARLAPEGAWARPVGVGALWIALGFASAGVGLALVRVAALTEAVEPNATLTLAALVAALGTLAMGLLEGSGPVASDVDVLVLRAGRLTQAAAALALVAAVAAGVESWWREASYVTPLTATAAAAGLLGLAALEPDAPLTGIRRLLFLFALLVLLVA
jgi:hypothetical protein